MKKQKQIEHQSDSLFVSKCHPYSTVNWREIIEDTDPSKVIAIVGRCHACMGVQRVLGCAYNIDRLKLAKALHGNSNWLLNSEVVKGLRMRLKYLHGELMNPSIPMQRKTDKPIKPGVVIPEERDFTESQDSNEEVPF